MTDLLEALLADLAAEGDVLDAAVATLPEGWRTPTPAAGWDVATQIAHLAWTDEVAITAATDKAGWDALVLEAIEDPLGYVDKCALSGGAVPPAELLARWRGARADLVTTLRAVPDGGQALVRTADVADLDGHRAAHGDVGALARRA